MAKDNFYSQRLSGAARALYDDCIKNIERGVLETSFTKPLFGMDGMVHDVIDAVQYGNPEFFYLENAVQYGYSGMRAYIKFKSKYGDLSAKRRELDAEINKIVSRVKICGSQYDRLCRISAYLGERIRGGNSLEPRFGDAYGALVLKEARCEGYAKAAKLIMDRAGISSEIALGDALHNGVKERHAWNIAYMNGKPYGFDFTWNDNGDTGAMPGICYLFLSDAEMSVEHFPRYKYPACTDASQTFWARNNGIVRSRADLKNIRLGHVGTSFMAAVKFENSVAARQLTQAALDAVMTLLSKLGKGNRASYFFNDRLNVLSVYAAA